MLKPSSILVCGRSAELLETRRWVLESAGFTVRTADDPSEAIRVLIDESVDLAILCHSLYHEECEAILAAVHSSRPESKILILYAFQKGCPPTDTASVLNIFEGPGKLISKVQEMTREAGSLLPDNT